MFVFAYKWLFDNFKNMAESFQLYIAAYLTFMAVISAIYCYYKGPITNPRALNIIEWLLKSLGIFLVYSGTSYKEISISLILAFTVANLVYNMNFKLNVPILKKIGYKMFPPKRKLLTKEEYMRQADEYTQKALHDLKEYCKSPECDKWKIISRVKSPEKLAKFIQNESNHIDDDEILEHDRFSVSQDLIDDDDDE
jgi:hypothetical protein